MTPGSEDELLFLPLGGSNEIGMNLNAYGYGPPHARKWIVVDIGVTFGGQEHPGVEIILPDPTFLEEHRADILAIILTHAHEDHLGALGWLWPRLKVPVYATPFTAALAREKLKERGLDGKVTLHQIPLKARLSLGPFEMEYVTLTHSIPEPNGLAIRTPLGLVFHTGDWKIDPDPLIGDLTDESRVRALGDDGVLAMVCDSTNVFVDGEAGSEADVRRELAKVVKACRGKVAITAFASNVARVESAMLAAAGAGRSVCLVGRSMKRVVGAAKAVGLLQDAPPLVSEEEAARLGDDQILYLCTGSQGEPRAALARIAVGDHRNVRLGDGDTVIFSSRVIPGNDIAIHALKNALVEKGVRLITDRDALIHVSGHPCRDELKRMYQWARPKIAVPTHGERRHLLEHARLALELQTPEAITPRNGDMVRLAPGPAAIIDEAPSGRIFVDGVNIIDADDEALKDRRRMAAEGTVSVTVAVSAKRRAIVSGPDVRVRGLAAGAEAELETALDEIAEAAEVAFNKLSSAERHDEEAAEEAIVRAVRRAAERAFGKRPLVDAVVLTV